MGIALPDAWLRRLFKVGVSVPQSERYAPSGKPL